jgi:ubiquinone/menaquinone biosynthesis C-methylase UbiE
MAQLAEDKRRARVMWAAGDYPSMAERIPELGAHTVERVGIKEGEVVLDIACGTGNAAIPAARQGARVTGLDLVPELLEAGRRKADDAGVEIDWVEGDAEALPFEDESFDVAVSTIGIMFAPRHQVAASELARMLKPGGRMGIASWTPEGGIGQFVKTIASHMPPPPEGFQPPVLWGTEEHVRELFEGSGIKLRFERAVVDIRFESVEDALHTYETKFGPVVMAKQTLESEGKWEALREDMGKVLEAQNTSAGEDLVTPGDYLLALGEKAPS